MKPLAIDLFCGLGGWTEGLLAEGWDVIGFDIERHQYGEAKYPAQMVLQDVLTLHGSQFKGVDLIVASPPCQAYSYRAMPWSRAKALPPPDNSLFEACFRIQREACEAAGRHIPLVVENVRGAQKWVGRARWNFGSFYLWGDVPALMPMVRKHVKVEMPSWSGYGKPGYKAQAFNGTAEKLLQEAGIKAGDRNKGRASGEHKWTSDFAEAGRKNNGGSWFNVAHNTTSGKGQNPDGRKGIPHRTAGHWTNPAEHEGVKQRGSGREWFAGEGKISRMTSSKSNARKAASAAIAKIPLALARHVAQVYMPRELECV